MFGNRLKEIRSKKGISQYRLAKISGVSQGLLSLYENDKVQLTIYTLKRLCNVLGVTATELLGF